MTTRRSTNKYPIPKNMNDMIVNSQKVLDLALTARIDKDTIQGIPDVLFRECEGILLLHVMEAAFLFAANIGTGILMARNKESNTWSPPCAVGLSGVGWGFIGGAARKDCVVFIMDVETMRALTSSLALNLAGQASFTIGDRGREVETSLHASNRGNVGATVAFSYARGFLVGLALEGSVVAPRHACNEKFYGQLLQAPERESAPRHILYEMDAGAIPERTAIADLHNKLQGLAETSDSIKQDVWYLVGREETKTSDEESDDDDSIVVVSNHVVPAPHLVGQARREDFATKDDEGSDSDESMEFVSKPDEKVLYQEAQTQTGIDDEHGNDDDVPVLLFGPPVAKQLKTDGKLPVTYQVAQTQTEAALEQENLFYSEAQTQTGDNNVGDAVSASSVAIGPPIAKQNTLRFVTHQVAQTQTDEQSATMETSHSAPMQEEILYQEVQTQTGHDDGNNDAAVLVFAPPFAKQTTSNNTTQSATYQVAQTQTNDQVDVVSTNQEDEAAIYQDLQTQTSGKDNDVVIIFERTTPMPQTSLSDQQQPNVMFQAAETQTDGEAAIGINDDDGDSDSENSWNVIDAM